MARVLLAIILLGGCYSPDLRDGASCQLSMECPDGQFCYAGVCSSGEQPNVFFVTSTPYLPSEIDGLSGANTICQKHADDARLAGEYKAWLGTTSSPAAGQAAESARGWVRPDGAPFADEASDIREGNVLYPPIFDEMEQPVPENELVRTASLDRGRETETGTGAGACGDWTVDDSGSVEGGYPERTYDFTSGGRIGCDEPSRIYCLGTDRYAPFPPRPIVGRIAFVTRDPFTPGGGLEAADSRCQIEADGAGINPDHYRYRALLATSDASASSRFADVTGPWVRPDGVVIGDDGELFARTLPTALNVTAYGGYVGGFVWTGASAVDASGDATCSNWQSMAPYGSIGRAESTETSFYAVGGAACDSEHRLYCLQTDEIVE